MEPLPLFHTLLPRDASWEQLQDTMQDITVTEDNMEDIAGCLARVARVQLTSVELGRGPRFWELLGQQDTRATWMKLSLMTVYEDQIKHMAAFLVRVEEVNTIKAVKLKMSNVSKPECPSQRPKILLFPLLSWKCPGSCT